MLSLGKDLQVSDTKAMNVIKHLCEFGVTILFLNLKPASSGFSLTPKLL